MVEMAMMKPNIPMNNGITMWKNRSPVVSECLQGSWNKVKPEERDLSGLPTC